MELSTPYCTNKGESRPWLTMGGFSLKEWSSCNFNRDNSIDLLIVSFKGVVYNIFHKQMRGGDGLKRVMVIGVSSGVGKSTFSQKMGAIMQMPVFHLDAYFWKPGWVESSVEEFTAVQEGLVGQDQWIIDGNYSSTLPVRLEKADTIVYLEMPLSTCLFRVFKRWVCHIGKTRIDMGEGCPEKIDYAFIRFILRTYRSRKAAMRERLRALDGTKDVIQLKNKKEMNQYLLSLKAQQQVEKRG
ncbi:topology modulation protein [Bacillus sp. 1P06AnD]|uniref:topology modulation protein n=1 Tax=Bacillus sp. 1P06AnD TaxID=3132208 RepID=UPI0039A19BAA